MGLLPEQLIRAGQVTGDDILLHYEQSHRRQNRLIVAPLYTKLLEHHWDRLRQQAITFRTQLSPPGIETLFGAEICRKVYNAAESASPLLSTSSWKKVIDAPFEVRLSGSATETAVKVKYLVEQEVLFPHLLSHMLTEFAEFTQFKAWKSQLGRLVQMCLERAENVTQSCSGAAGMNYIGGGKQKWLSFHFPAYVCQFVFNHLHSETMPTLHTELQPDGLWKLMPEESPATTLALDTDDHIHRCQEILINEVRENTGLEVWREIGKGLAGLQTKTDQLQTPLTTVVERGNFKGTCSLCEDYCFLPECLEPVWLPL